MALSRMFVKADISSLAKGQVWVSTITYSFYGLYHYDQVATHNTMEEARNHVLTERCGGMLVVRNA
jgi:hypothetical protein